MNDVLMWAVALFAGLGVMVVAYKFFNLVFQAWDEVKAENEYEKQNKAKDREEDRIALSRLFQRVYDLELKVCMLEKYQNGLFYGQATAPNSVEESTKYMGQASTNSGSGSSVTFKRGRGRPRKAVHG